MRFRAWPGRGACLVLLSGAGLGAQAARAPAASAADVAILQGRLDDAEQELFAASSRAAHEPSARGALGMFLASRGRLKVGAVLLEEAREFGGDASVIDARLARIYAWLGDWTAVAALKHYAPAGPEHDRARWLAAHTPVRSGPDSVMVALEPNEMAGLGRIELTIGRATMQADIDPDIEGLVLPSSPDVSGESQQFGMRDSASVAVVFGVRIGTMRLTNVQARLSPAARPAIGLDVLAALTPTFDAGAHLLTLRQRAAASSGDPLPILLSFPGVKFVARAGQPPVAIGSAAGGAALRGARWTFDVRRGAIVVQR
ncbi:MAG: tetratricopeptide repeat protein [Gemmatimonadales bacterium]